MHTDVQQGACAVYEHDEQAGRPASGPGGTADPRRCREPVNADRRLRQARRYHWTAVCFKI